MGIFSLQAFLTEVAFIDPKSSWLIHSLNCHSDALDVLNKVLVVVVDTMLFQNYALLLISSS
jgi:hypothetical protein